MPSDTPPPDLDARARALLAPLSVPEKLSVVTGDTPFWPGVTEMLTAYNHRPWPAGSLPHQGIPGIRFTDGPRGVALGSSTCFPVSMARGATWDPHLEARVGDAMGVEARVQGANLLGAVCINLLRHPAWGRAQETYGDDPVHVGRMGAALTRGVQRHVMACVKHFACNSIEGSRYRVDVQASDKALHETWLPHFRDCVDAGAASVMSAYNRLNGAYCAENPALLTDILRGQWGFDGFVVSDFVFGLRDGARALAAGMDLEMPFPHCIPRDAPPALARGLLSAAQLDDAVLRLVRQQLRFDAVGEPARYTPDAVACDDHRALARTVATRSMVLLHNAPLRGAPLLPLDASRLRRVAVLGPLAARANLGDRGSSAVRPGTVVNVLDGLRAALPDARVDFDPGDDLGRVHDLARDADVAVVVVGLSADDEGEGVAPGLQVDLARAIALPPLREVGPLWRAVQGATGIQSAGDRATLGLSPQDVLRVRTAAAANPATVVVLMGGSALTLDPWLAHAGAVVMAWYPGMEGGAALADLLLGRAEFTGRLPSVWADEASWYPPFDPRAAQVTYEAWTGQRWMESRGHTPRRGLGFGLGYTRFSRVLTEALATGDAVLARVAVTNLGARPGDALVMLRARPEGDVEPSRLVGFARVAVGPGETQTATVTAPLRGFARWHETRGGWSLPTGPVRVWAVGASGERTIRLG
jgi:beta-glucosidase